MPIGFLPLLFGGDINVYSVARAFHEAYGIPCTCYGKYPSGPCFGSAIIDYRAAADVDTEHGFLRSAQEFAAAHPDEKILLIGCGDSYVQLAAACKNQLPPNVIAPYGDGEQLDRLMNKEYFYSLCDELDIPHPQTFIHYPDMGQAFDLPFAPPYICKPSDGVSYWAHPFEGNEKVFLLDTREALCATLDKVYASGYTGSMVIQEFIPGGDDAMRVLTCYSNRRGEVVMMCLGHVLLEEHTPHGKGNHAVILTEQNDALCAQVRTFLEGIHFTGFSNFDIKYDLRDGVYKLFEINCRQGRSNYYVTAAGQNIARWLVEDYIEDKPQIFTMADKEILWRVVPRPVLWRYIPRAHHEKLRTLIRAGAEVNPLVNPGGDRRFMRALRILKHQLGQILKYRKYMKRAD